MLLSLLNDVLICFVGRTFFIFYYKNEVKTCFVFSNGVSSLSSFSVGRSGSAQRSQHEQPQSGNDEIAAKGKQS
jgi:hypothetical protein